jgi:hypothetical protein
MKHLEELSRMHIEEAIQTGLKRQAIHRALSEHKDLALLASPEREGRFKPQQFSWQYRFILLINTVLKSIG